MDRLVIREMLPEDMEGKAYVHWKSWQDTYDGLVPREYLDKLTVERCRERTAQHPEDTEVAVLDGKVVGFVMYGAYRGEGPAGCGEVYALYLLKEYQHLGLGRALMDEALKRLSGYGKTAVWVLKDNAQAVRFYEKAGFEPDGAEDKLDLGGPVTVLRMTKDNTKAQGE